MVWGGEFFTFLTNGFWGEISLCGTKKRSFFSFPCKTEKNCVKI